MTTTPTIRDKILERAINGGGTEDEIIARAEKFLAFVDPPVTEQETSVGGEITEVGWLEAMRVYALQMGQNVDAMNADAQERMKWLTKQVVLAALKPRAN